MKINISGFRGEGKSKIAREVAHLLNKEGKSIRVVDGCNSEEMRGAETPRRGKMKVWDVTIRVRNIYAPAQD